MTLVYPSKDMNWKSIETITIVGLTISTLNFPYYYKRGGLWYWRILNFYENGYINMVFPNVSFNIYKVSKCFVMSGPHIWRKVSD